MKTINMIEDDVSVKKSWKYYIKKRINMGLIQQKPAGLPVSTSVNKKYTLPPCVVR